MSEAGKIVGIAAYDLLQPFHNCQQRPLTAVLQKEDAEGETLLLIFGDGALVLCCDADTDALVMRFEAVANVDDFAELTGDAPWSRFIGKPFFWGWLTINQQGYTDGALLSFDGVVPEVGVNVVASSLEVVTVTRVNS